MILTEYEDPTRYTAPPDPDASPRHEEEYDGDAIEEEEDKKP